MILQNVGNYLRNDMV